MQVTLRIWVRSNVGSAAAHETAVPIETIIAVDIDFTGQQQVCKVQMPFPFIAWTIATQPRANSGISSPGSIVAPRRIPHPSHDSVG